MRSWFPAVRLNFRENHSRNELHVGIDGGRFDAANSIDTALPAPFWHQTVAIPNTPCDGEVWSNQQTKGGVIRDFDGDGRPDVVLVAYTDLGFPDTRCPVEQQTFTDEHGLLPETGHFWPVHIPQPSWRSTNV